MHKQPLAEAAVLLIGVVVGFYLLRPLVRFFGP